MKLKTLLYSAAAAGALSSAAQAQTIIDIVGSSAGRSAVHSQILTLLQGETYAYDGTSSASAATRAIYHGTYAGSAVIVRTYWAGSVNGVRDVAQATQQTELFATSVIGNASGQNVNPAVKASASAATVPEIGFSDVFQTSTAFTSPSLTVEDEVGVIPFKWYKNAGSSSSLTNITPLLAQQLYGSLAELPLALFTGNSGDQGTTVYALGRNADSGTRITAMAESGFGVFKSVEQYGASVTISGAAITNLGATGNGGYSSGSASNGLGFALTKTFAGGAVVGYLGLTDGASAESAGAVALAWNGVAYSDTAVRQGQYTFWGYLHQNRMALAGTQLGFYDALKAGLLAAPGNGLLSIGSMSVQRNGDGAPVYNSTY